MKTHYYTIDVPIRLIVCGRDPYLPGPVNARVTYAAQSDPWNPRGRARVDVTNVTVGDEKVPWSLVCEIYAELVSECRFDLDQSSVSGES